MRIKLFLIFWILKLNSMSAAQFIGANISYQCIDTIAGTYVVTLNLFQDCQGANYGMEKLTIEGCRISSEVNMNFISKKETTELCWEEDSTLKTNCPGPNNPPLAPDYIHGIMKWTYQKTVTVGKKCGMVFFIWRSCCRDYSIIQNPPPQKMYIQAMVNTNFPNSSAKFNFNENRNWHAGIKNTMDLNIVKPSKEEYLMIKGKKVLFDSFVYSFYAPWTGEFVFDGTIYSPSEVIYSPPFNQLCFVNSNNQPVSLDEKTGIISTIPQQFVTSLYGFKIDGWRAIADPYMPNGYHRVYLGYVVSDLQFKIYAYADPIEVHGVLKDSLEGASIDSNKILYLMYHQSTKINIKASAYRSLKARINVLDTNNIHGFKTNLIQKTNDTILYQITIDSFDKELLNTERIFNIQFYYCNTFGTRIVYDYPLTLKFVNPSCDSFLLNIEKTGDGIFTNDVSMKATIQNGSGHCAYLWSNNEKSNQITNKPQGFYSVFVTDSIKGCYAYKEIFVRDTNYCEIWYSNDIKERQNDTSKISLTSTQSGNNISRIYWEKDGTILPQYTSISLDIQSPTSKDYGTYCVYYKRNDSCESSRCIKVNDTFCNQKASFQLVLQKDRKVDLLNTSVFPDSNIISYIRWNSTNMDSISYNSSKNLSFQYPYNGVVDICIYVIKKSNLCIDSFCQTIDAYQCELQVRSTKINANAGSNNGSIILKVSNGKPSYTYKWNDGFNAYSRKNLSPGIYCYTVTDARTCSVSKCDTVDRSNSILDPLPKSLDLHPNPTKDFLNINLSKEMKKAQVLIYSADGRLVREEAYNKTIQVKDLVNGLYLIQVMNDTEVYQAKFIKE